MDLLKVIKERKTIRAYKPDPIPKERIEEILRLTIHAPSAINLQPWEFIVVTGEEKERLSRRLIKAYKEKQIACSPGNVKPLPKTYGKRGAKTLALMKPFFEEMGVDIDQYINEGSCRFYGAPAAILFCLDDSFPKARLVDIGIALGYLVLTAHEFGLGTCPIGLINAYEDEIKDLLNIPENKTVVIGVALGYPDGDVPINRFKSTRDDLSRFVRWIE
ncbi:MAG: nitroreductase [Deltaproteobacteria bacterium RBG_16_47_11]|nr:MAG: nitroreductase [Deltaproteobacteria bacterium RBG_16_47_11]